MDLSDKIFVAGHTGLVGSALVRRLKAAGYHNLLLRTRAELDLRDAGAVRDFFSENRPRYVFLAAAKVGGIFANQTLPADFIFDNLRIQTNVIDDSCRSGVERILFLGSSCIYPKRAPQPLREESWLGGPLEPSNRAYAVAKIAGMEMGWAYNRQHGTRFVAAMPTNLYGPGDRYDPNHSHLIPALIRKMHEAKTKGLNEVVIWGTGTPRREFLHSEDAADACIFLMNLPPEPFQQLAGQEDLPPLVNVGCGEDMTVREIAELVAEIVGIAPTFIFDASKPDGTPRKLLDVGRLAALGWKPRISLREGLRQTYDDFCSRATQLRPGGGGPSTPVTQCVS
ncbi:MAG: fcl [Candidatus Sulfotelmatobacter sp.]|nr:fcl [Candidatus Sulfotelmatobacter sp.]